MDGYSIEEAAAVLGIPEGRVWELIARGVLSGTPQAGGAMRVYLRASSRAEAGSAVAHDTPAAAQSSRPASHGNGNGNGGSSTFELGPFRELLTEFRNLTERYGQALLALGEARGEVAALRQRVELLEARVDLRLPAAAAASTRAAPWASSPVEHWPEPAAGAAGPDEAEAPAPEPAAEAPPPAAPPQEERGGDVAAAAERGAVDEVRQAPAEPEPEPEPPANGGSRRHRRRQRQARAAIEGFAQALARADDPAGVELPGSEDAAAAFEALNREIAAASSPAPATPADHAELGEDAVAAAEVIEQVEMESPAPDASAEAGLEARAADTAELEAAGPPSERETVEEAGVSSERETVEEAAPADAPEPALTAELPSDAATPPAAVEPPGREEPPGLDETPPVGEAAGTVESLSSSAIYSAGWEEPDWIAEEDLGDIDLTEDEGGSAAPELEATLEPAPAPLDDVAVAGLTDDAGLLDRAPVAYQDLVDAPDGEAPEEDAPEGGPLDEATWVASPGTGDAAIGAQVAEPAPPAGTADAELAETDVADVSGPSAQPEPEARVEPIAEGAEVAEAPKARTEPIGEVADMAEAEPEPEPESSPSPRRDSGILQVGHRT